MTKQNKIVIGVIAIILTLSIGYALFSKTINVGGTASASGNFDIIFNKVGTITGAASKNATAIITPNKKELTINIENLEYPGAYVEIPVIIKNNGSINASVQGIVTTGLDNNDIKVSYTGVTNYMMLAPNDEKEMIIKVLWDRNSVASNVSLSFMIAIDYVQNYAYEPSFDHPYNSEYDIPTNMLIIKDNVFTGLTQEGLDWVKTKGGINFPYGISKINDTNIFYNMANSLRHVFIPNSVEYIGSNFFRDTALEYVEIPPSVKTIGNEAFAGIQAKTASHNYGLEVEFNEGLEIVGDAAFANTYGLGYNKLPSTLKEIGNYAFGATGGDPHPINLSEGLEILGPYSFIYHIVSGELVIPNSVTSMGEYAFADNQIETIKIGNKLEVIEEGTFSDNSMLTGEIYIPDNVTEIKDKAFAISDSRENKITKISISKNTKYVDDGTENSSFYGRPKPVVRD